MLVATTLVTSSRSCPVPHCRRKSPSSSNCYESGFRASTTSVSHSRQNILVRTVAYERLILSRALDEELQIFERWSTGRSRRAAGCTDRTPTPSRLGFPSHGVHLFQDEIPVLRRQHRLQVYGLPLRSRFNASLVILRLELDNPGTFHHPSPSSRARRRYDHPHTPTFPSHAFGGHPDPEPAGKGEEGSGGGGGRSCCSSSQQRRERKGSADAGE